MDKIVEAKIDFLELCDDDLTGIWAAIDEIRDRYPNISDDMLKSLSLQVVGDLLAAGLIEAGYPKDSFADFQPLADQTPENVVRQLQREWDELGREPSIGDGLWFVSTAGGQQFLRGEN